ncbi:hypothetical protein [Streptomyces sp. NPDC052107]|uniref:hypothetical protein n=1 Tax=Streptomyces sp. NPDC052107 TaxID=3155632 RepID=UPI003431B400
MAGRRIGPAPGGRLAVQVFPHNAFDRLLLNGFRAEVWTTPVTTERDLRTRAGLGQRTPQHTRGVALVLGAGNIFCIPPLDVLYRLYAENRTAVLELNPNTDAPTDVYRTIFKAMLGSRFENHAGPPILWTFGKPSAPLPSTAW